MCGIPFSAPRSTNHPGVPDFTNRDAMGFGPIPPTYNVYLIDEDSVVTHSIDFLFDDEIEWLATTSSGWIDEEDAPAA